MAVSVTPIPATRNKFSSQIIDSTHKRKVAGYARVSTDMDEQFTSFEAQVDYYTRFIQSHSDWEYVNVYSDEGISGTSTARRSGFQKMISDALDGRIDLIITKSVSRFARNTVDTLTIIRELKDNGVECYFEKENIWTFDSKGEVLITIMASLAQEESRSMSENIKWAVNKKFEKGKFSLPYKCFLGYDRGEDGMPVVNEKEAEIVKEIYQRYLVGQSPLAICHELEKRQIKAPRGGDRWSVTTISSILQNEKYSGNAVLQKSFTVDFLTKKKQKNNGEVSKYYVTGCHEAIISKEEFDMVQLEWESRKESGTPKSYSATVFSGRVICGECGTAYGSKVWHSNDKYRRVIFQCNHKYKDADRKCGTPHLTETELKDVSLKAINQYLTNKDEVISNLEILKDTLYSNAGLQREHEELTTEIEVSKEMYRKAISSGPLTDSSRFNSIQERYVKALNRCKEIEDTMNRNKNGITQFNKIIKNLKEADEQITEFTDSIFTALVDHITVFSKEKIVLIFRDGSEQTTK